MTRAKSRTIREIIEDYDSFMSSGADVGVKNRQIYVALKEIETIILESLPEESKVNGYNESALSKYSVGYNLALSDTKANLLKILGGESE